MKMLELAFDGLIKLWYILTMILVCFIKAINFVLEREKCLNKNCGNCTLSM
jgi:hypothetical protein